MKCSFWPRRKNMKRQTETVTCGFNRPLNQFAQHQDKTWMYNFLRWQPPLPQLAALSSASLPHLSWLNSVRSISHFLFPFLCRAAGNKLTESKWGCEEDKVSTICRIYCSQQNQGRLISVELLKFSLFQSKIIWPKVYGERQKWVNVVYFSCKLSGKLTRSFQLARASALIHIVQQLPQLKISI